MRHRYFVDDQKGPLFQALAEIFKQREAARGALSAFITDIGATNMYGSSPASYVFDFKSSSDADPAIWAKTKPNKGVYYFRPRKNTPEGKAMAKRIKELSTFPRNESAMATIPNLPYDFPVVLEGNMGYRPFIRFATLDDPGVVIVSIPWRDPDPKELAEYIEQSKDKEKRTHWSAALDYAQWTPPEWLREVKEWEALKLIDDLVAAV